jgi:hypothetical protein
MSDWGQIRTAKHVTDAVRDTLKSWLYPALAEVARQHGLDPTAWPDKAGIPPVRTWRARSFSDLLAAGADQLPAVFATTAGGGFSEDEEAIDGSWSTTVTIVARGQDFDTTGDIVKLYVAAARVALVQHPRLGGIARSISPRREEYDSIDARGGRTLAAGFFDFDVALEAVVNPAAGPAVPPADPFAVPAADPLADPIVVAEAPIA